MKEFKGCCDARDNKKVENNIIDDGKHRNEKVNDSELSSVRMEDLLFHRLRGIVYHRTDPLPISLLKGSVLRAKKIELKSFQLCIAFFRRLKIGSD